MDKEFAKSRGSEIDRSTWKPGPWDEEPNYCEWTTKADYPAWAGRLPSGAWYLIIEAPLPTGGTKMLAFLHTMKDESPQEHDATPGHCTPTDREGISQFCFSMEHWECPGPSERTWWRGPYKTLADVKERSEVLSDRIAKIHKEGTYVNYFENFLK